MVSFGGATAFKAEFSFVNSVECAVLIPDLTRHYDVVEIISAKFLREHFSLVDGDIVTIHYHDLCGYREVCNHRPRVESLIPSPTPGFPTTHHCSFRYHRLEVV